MNKCNVWVYIGNEKVKVLFKSFLKTIENTEKIMCLSFRSPSIPTMISYKKYRHETFSVLGDQPSVDDFESYRLASSLGFSRI